MPEYLAPGVYVEEVSFRSKSIEGVGTSTAGFVGPTRFGPVGGPAELVTSFPEFSRLFGGLDYLEFWLPENPPSKLPPADNYMAHAARSFFDNGGTRLYVSRIYEPNQAPVPGEGDDLDEDTRGKAFLGLGSPPAITLRARFPGAAGNMNIRITAVVGPNRLTTTGLTGLSQYALVYLRQKDPSGGIVGDLYDAIPQADGSLGLVSGGGAPLTNLKLDGTFVAAHLITLNVTANLPGRFGESESWQGLVSHPKAQNSLLRFFDVKPASRRQYLETPFVIELTDSGLDAGPEILEALFVESTPAFGSSITDFIELGAMTDAELIGLSPDGVRPTTAQMTSDIWLSGGDDGKIPGSVAYHGDQIGLAKTGLLSFEDIDEIAIVAAPGSSAKYGHEQALDDDRTMGILSELQIHVEKMRYRVAVLDSRDNDVLSEVQDFRGRFDSKHMAFYYPWVTAIDPMDPDGRREVNLPPSGYVAGIYARNDVQHGVFKAPANEVVLGAVGFETLLNKAQQDILNPQGINCFRYFPGTRLPLVGSTNHQLRSGMEICQCSPLFRLPRALD